jgi:hypothetical protein
VPDELESITIALPHSFAERLHEMATYTGMDLSHTVGCALAITDATMTMDEAQRLASAGTITAEEAARRTEEVRRDLAAAIVTMRPKFDVSPN